MGEEGSLVAEGTSRRGVIIGEDDAGGGVSEEKGAVVKRPAN